MFFFQITPHGGQGSFRHMYKLQRGVTNATIQDISFSEDSRWMAVSSTRGTTHIYAINPTGGLVNIHTHLRSSLIRQSDWHWSPDQTNSWITLAACNRIKQVSLEDSNSKGQIPTIASTSAFVGFPFATEKMFVMTQVGILSQYQLKPHGPQPGGDVDPATLQLTVEPLVEWDVCRKTKWPELPWEPPKESQYKYEQPQEGEDKWLSNIEISNHSPLLRPLWASPQFTFKTFQPLKSHHIQEEPESKNHYLFYENTPTRKVEVRHNEPSPFREGLESSHTYPGVNSDVANAPSAPPVSEELIKENIFKAMNTPLESKGMKKEIQPPFADINGSDLLDLNERKLYPSIKQSDPYAHLVEDLSGDVKKFSLPLEDSYFGAQDN